MYTLILYYNTNSYYFPYIQESTIKCFKVYRKINKIISFLHRVPIISCMVYGKWTKILNNCDRIIIFDNAFDVNLARYLKKHFKGKIYVYFWNTALSIDKKNNLIVAKKYFPVFSFDKEDCYKLDLNYAPMVYSRDIVSTFFEKNAIIKYDDIFVGWDKGRREELYSIYNILKNMNMRCFFLIRDSKKEVIHEDFNITDQNLKYEEYLKLLNSCSVIIDIQQKGQEGLTIRTLEAMFFRKKIITNKQDIDTYDFFCQENIFILGKSDNSTLQGFISSPYKSIPKEVESKYDLKYWINKYFNI